MPSLVFLCARQLLRHQASACRALAQLPEELYPVLFKAAFMDGKPLVLQELVRRWPFALLSFRELLRECRHCGRTLLRERPGRDSLQAVILGLAARLRQPPPARRRQQLQVLDMTGLPDGDGSGSSERDPKTMSMWARTVAVAKTCIAVGRRQAGAARRPSKRPTVDRPALEVRADLLVNRTSYGVLREALASGGPVRLLCRDLRAEELSLTSTVGLLELLDPLYLRQVDLRFNNLGLSGLCVVIPHMAKFANLLSLKLQYSNVDVRRLSAEMEGSFRYFVAQLGKLGRLRELNMGSSRLSGRLRQLLSGLRSPLESLELAFCYLLPADFSYLSQSPHASALKKLDLSGNNLSPPLLGPFRTLLREASPSLLHLEATECQLTDAHLATVLPALGRCARLRYLGLFGNPLSTQGLKALLRRTEGLGELRLVVYPFPVDCYRGPPRPPPAAGPPDGELDRERLSLVQAELLQMLRAARRAHVLWTTDAYGHGALDYFSL
ncbi:leucine-rich repeat-containing protein 14 [Tachyglossus aculeatus]|uniref:leucine-rich repeat-containing protein 14 n=1 Tax=Tachyglossus aculeatus TaxID=9261 RepID=UPI0018F5E1D8|nr:leucine-rich repeat-containing protein 14 [Tachyglossus aculeatus]